MTDRPYVLYPPEVEPTTLAELKRVVGGQSTDPDAIGYGMFWCMRGIPKAFMELPEFVGDGVVVRRYVYQVLGFESKLPREAAEPRLVSAAYRFLVARRREALAVLNIPDLLKYPPTPPVMFVRRDFELSPNFEENVTRLTYRVCIPGINLAQYDIYLVKNQITYVQVDE